MCSLGLVLGLTASPHRPIPTSATFKHSFHVLRHRICCISLHFILLLPSSSPSHTFFILPLSRRTPSSRRTRDQPNPNLAQNSLSSQPFPGRRVSSLRSGSFRTLPLLHRFWPLSVACWESSVWSDLGLGCHFVDFFVLGVEFSCWETWEFGSIQMFQCGGLLFDADCNVFGCFAVSSSFWDC